MNKLERTLRFLFRPLIAVLDWFRCPHRHLSAPRISHTGRIRRECFDCLKVIESPVAFTPRAPCVPISRVETAVEREAREAAERELARRVKQIEDDEREWFGRR
jgi:hypothetical protein